MSHTPGPWKLLFTGPASTPDWHIQTQEGRSITILAPTTTKTAETARYNAALIATAPELLAALESLVKWMDDSGLSRTKPAGKGVFYHEGTEYSVVTEARAAIARAKGVRE